MTLKIISYIDRFIHVYKFTCQKIYECTKTHVISSKCATKE